MDSSNAEKAWERFDGGYGLCGHEPSFMAGYASRDAEVAELTAENEKLRAKLDMPCGSCHPCTQWANQTWINAGLPLPHVLDWEELKAKHDKALRKLGKSRARFADSEARRAELEAVVAAVRKLATGPVPTVDEWWPLLRSIAETASASPSVVLEDRDRENRAIGWDEGYGDDSDVNTPRINPYRGDNR